MSHIEQSFRQFLSTNPAIETCYQEGLINRRSLARYVIKHGVAQPHQLEAVIAMLRRFPFEQTEQSGLLFTKIKINIKDNILILDFEKEKALVQQLQNLITHTNYDRGDTLKIVVGSTSVKVFLDEANEHKVKDIVEQFTLHNRLSHISEISLMFMQDAIDQRGILSAITRELTMHHIVVSELLTASPELLVYLKDKFVLQAYDILKRLQQ